MSAKHRPKKEGSRKKNKNEGSGKKERHEPNLGQVEAREEKEKASNLPHMGEMSDQSQSKRPPSPPIWRRSESETDPAGFSAMHGWT
jgi:hypothetical protein